MPPSEPRVIDRYVLAAPIATGGMGTVHLARRLGAAGFAKVMAVKRMRPDLVTQPEFLKMFLDEARLAGRIDHVNVVRTLDVVADGQELLLVMEYVHGESLGGLLRLVRESGERIPPAIACAIMAGALHGLHAAHEAKNERGEPLQIVHRDVSPQNILVGVDGIARVADFGVARAVGQLHTTTDGEVRGKSRYMAPEQVRGDLMTRQVDVFAASNVLWEAIVGEPLFQREADVAALLAVLNDPITAPGIKVPSLPEAVDEVVLRGLERDPTKRWATALDMAQALERAIPIARPAEVAAWVRATAHERLAAREALIARIEAGEDVQSDPDALAGATATRDVTTIQSTTPGLRPTLRARAPLLLAVAVVLVGAMSVAARLVTSTPATPLSAAAPSEAPTPKEVASVAPADAAAAARAVASAPGSTTAAPRPPVRGATRKPGQKPSKSCDPPYELDQAGAKVFKLECL